MKRMSVAVLCTACNWHEIVRLQTLRATLGEKRLADRTGFVAWEKVMAVVEDELIDMPHTFRGTTFAHVA